MPRTRDQVLAAGRDIKQHLSASEQAIDNGLVAQANLLASLLTAQIALGFAPQFQRDLVTGAGATIADGLAQRERLMALHGRLSDVSDRFRLDPKALGDGGDKDAPDAMPWYPATGLSLVAEA